jgi:hypothetical protein
MAERLVHYQSPPLLGTRIFDVMLILASLRNTPTWLSWYILEVDNRVTSRSLEPIKYTL